MRYIILALFVLVAVVQPAKAQLEVDITSGKVEALPIAVSKFHPENPAYANFARDMPAIIARNLQNSGLFNPLSPQSFIQSPESIAAENPRFGEWRAINAQALVSGTVTKAEDGRTRVEFRLWDVFSQQQLTGMAYMTNEQNWRRICLLYTSPSPRDLSTSRMPSSA